MISVDKGYHFSLWALNNPRDLRFELRSVPLVEDLYVYHGKVIGLGYHLLFSSGPGRRTVQNREERRCMSTYAFKALNEIKASLGWRVVYAWVGDDPCGDGDLPPWSGVTCSQQGDYRVVTEL
ncbi:hypothetical protein M5K25_005720 [Dendrobium thyrsiflorum]|uniref:Uncharacterized protein n=1 Tax=Dendrobium thyrsiflorum TaxID=117978 RepID=A0ABD0VQV8_DENTH